MTASRPEERYLLRFVRDESTRRVTLVARDEHDKYIGETTRSEMGSYVLVSARYPDEATDQHIATLNSEGVLDLDWKFNKTDLLRFGFDPDELEPQPD
jgi:hypothetical protein